MISTGEVKQTLIDSLYTRIITPSVNSFPCYSSSYRSIDCEFGNDTRTFLHNMYEPHMFQMSSERNLKLMLFVADPVFVFAYKRVFHVIPYRQFVIGEFVFRTAYNPP